MFGRMVAGGLLIATAAASLTACSSGSGSSDGGSGEFTILAILGLSGGLATTADLNSQGANYAVDELNKNGGINGKKVILKTLDDQSSATTAVTVLQQYLSSGKKIDALIPGLTSPETLALLPVAARQNVIAINGATSAALNDPKKFPHYFSMVPTSAYQLTAAGLKDQLEKVSAKNISVLLPNDAFGTGEYAAVQAALKDTGITTKLTTFDPTAVNLTVPYAAAMSDQPDAVFVDAEGSSEAPLMNARQKVDGALTTPTFTGSFISSNPPALVAPPAALTNFLMPEYDSIIGTSDGSPQSPTLTTMLKSLDAKSSTAISLVIAHDSINLLALAAKKANSTSADDMQKAIESGLTIPEDYLISTTDLGYSPTNHFVTGTKLTWIPATSTLKNGIWQAGS